ncbi:hypothetical protein M407DRAFT_17833 [Tulasnella calospora MUT 4182]|uniref:Uncharacterized protein n=1 Tax=Tulasnella calospora MUT 4182 TaxID=1051891 RepID=A0A0C3QUX5_9AGAM|nr:hypothetical protein M407DRAFT_17833 [Tulasnella calospora MUT 4182]
MDASQIIFHGKFNFQDGNILVSARGSRDGQRSSLVETVYFRLHKSILAIYSTTFAEMLSISQDRASVGHLQDPLDHVIKLLTAMYYGGSVPKDPLSRAKWDFLVPLLTLTNKYDIGSLTADLLPKLSDDWPTTLEKWDAVDAQTKSIVCATAGRREQNLSLPSPDEVLPEPVMAIKFGQAYPGARSILPAAFYHLSRLSHSRRDDIGVWNPEGPEVFRSADCNRMTSEDWMRVVRGQANIRDWLWNLATCKRDLDLLSRCPRRAGDNAETMEEEEDDNEGTPNPCGRVRWWNREIGPLVLQIAAKRVVDVLGQLTRLHGVIQRVDRTTTSEDELCFDCQINLDKWLIEFRNRFSMRLPFFFDLGEYPNWGT